MFSKPLVGLDETPVTNVVSRNTPLNESNLGLEVSIKNDKISPTHENIISADFSYTIAISETFQLSFGIKATANLFDLDITRLNPVDNNYGIPIFLDRISHS